MVSRVVRSCVGCRSSRLKKELIRVHLVPGEGLTVDLAGGTGRGVYVCPRRGCLELAVKRGEFVRCLKEAVAPLTVEMLDRLIRERVVRKVSALIGLALRARKVALGVEAVESAVRRHSARLILGATDASANSVTRLRTLALEAGTAWMQVMGKEQMGAALGRAPLACIAVTDPQFAGAVMSTIEKIPVEVEVRETAWSGRRSGGGAEPRKVWR